MLPPTAFLGLGRMGHPMAARLLDARVPLAVWNRTAARAASLVERGARQAATPADAARGADVVVLMLTDAGAVDRVLVGEGGLLDALAPGAVIADCSTIGPEEARAFAALAAERGVGWVDAPVLGSTPAAAKGTLTILAGGRDADVERAEPVLRALGERIVRTGPSGSASTLKLAMNLLVGGVTELLAESILLAAGAGVSLDVYRETLFASVLDSPFLRYKAPQLLERRFAPLFTTALMRKDLELVLAEGARQGLTLAGTRAARDAYAAAEQAGHAEDDMAAVIEAVAGKRGGA